MKYLYFPKKKAAGNGLCLYPLSSLEAKFPGCPRARAVEMGRGGLMIADNETIKGENGQIVRGGDLSAEQREGICPDEHCYLFILPHCYSVDWLGRSSQVKSVS